jgi:hypothetical protein
VQIPAARGVYHCVHLFQWPSHPFPLCKYQLPLFRCDSTLSATTIPPRNHTACTTTISPLPSSDECASTGHFFPCAWAPRVVAKSACKSVCPTIRLMVSRSSHRRSPSATFRGVFQHLVTWWLYSHRWLSMVHSLPVMITWWWLLICCYKLGAYVMYAPAWGGVLKLRIFWYSFNCTTS